MASKTKQTAFRIPDDIAAAMRRVKDEVGIPASEQVRRALREWLTKQGALRVAKGGKVK
jgi:hypothetical protein